MFAYSSHFGGLGKLTLGGWSQRAVSSSTHGPRIFNNLLLSRRHVRRSTALKRMFTQAAMRQDPPCVVKLTRALLYVQRQDSSTQVPIGMCSASKALLSQVQQSHVTTKQLRQPLKEPEVRRQ
jgi:hypothetical protein